MVRKTNTVVVCAVMFILVYLLIPQERTERKYQAAYSIPKEFITFNDSESRYDDWHCIDQSVCVYSAYWDERFSSPFVRLIAVISSTANVSSWRCLLKHNDAMLEETSLTVENIPEGHNKKYNAIFILCSTKNKPVKVKLIADQLSTPSIMVRTIKFNKNEKIAVCVRPTFGDFPDNNLIVAEFISYYREVGVEQFTFYDYESSHSFKQLLDELMAKGFPIVLLPWSLPKKFSQSWSFGQMASIADCSYRNSYSYEFVAILDVDEFLVPKEDTSLQDVIKRSSGGNGKWGTYVFRQTFFCMEYEDDPDSANLTIPLVTQRKTKHESKVWPYFHRSKCIIRPAAVVTPGIHFTWTHLKSSEALRVSTDIALLHHYRANVCNVGKKNSGVTDKTALRYGKRIFQSPALQMWKRNEFLINHNETDVQSAQNIYS